MVALAAVVAEGDVGVIVGEERAMTVWSPTLASTPSTVPAVFALLPWTFGSPVLPRRKDAIAGWRRIPSAARGPARFAREGGLGVAGGRLVRSAADAGGVDALAAIAQLFMRSSTSCTRAVAFEMERSP